MTAEIAIMNKNAVALAADSAMTIEITGQQGITKKIYNSCNKLFSLSKYHPVGIMIYGSTGLTEIPLELLIKIYRNKLGTGEFNTLREYAQNFIDYLGSAIPEENKRRHIILNLSDFFYNRIRSIIDAEVKEQTSKTPITVNEIKKIIAEVIQSSFTEYGNREKLNDLPCDFETTFLSTYQNEIELSITNVFGKLPITKHQRNKLMQIAVFLYTRDIFSSGYCGIVFAGYGKSEIFPSVFSIIVDGAAGGKIKYKIINDRKIDEKTTSTIVPFAQQEMVRLFVEGIDPNYENFVSSLLGQIIIEYPSKLVEKISNISDGEKKAILDPLKDKSNEILVDLQKEMLEYKRTRYIDKIISAVTTLPKEELAEMAESLVNLTSFKRRMTFDAETVGGPIDVAVISKIDGFIWIKRKHYFDPKLNHQFFCNYFRIFEGGTDENQKQS